ESGQLTELVNAKFETAYSVEQIRAYKKNHKITSGISTHFEKGHISHNAGKSGLKIPGSEKGWFKKRQPPT
ncbi:MAG: HNH endonuclease, partial [Oscillibacter sp.]